MYKHVKASGTARLDRHDLQGAVPALVRLAARAAFAAPVHCPPEHQRPLQPHQCVLGLRDNGPAVRPVAEAEGGSASCGNPILVAAVHVARVRTSSAGPLPLAACAQGYQLPFISCAKRRATGESNVRSLFAQERMSSS